ncbi:hypothetical protein B4N89_45045 [Embleya scabrispora]|uniref:Uncharacterized protein n=1 Tax=Embleya scabrispora TaxID=159449 RepID=A0A1T3NIZ8_9ACTN|nr:hypothetical protein B4N89_45045 [Embleya scabrispora]
MGLGDRQHPCAVPLGIRACDDAEPPVRHEPSHGTGRGVVTASGEKRETSYVQSDFALSHGQAHQRHGIEHREICRP